MHAIIVENYGDASVLQWREQPDPTPGPGEVTIRVSASGVNFADIQRRRGGYRGAPPPFTPGLDCAGTIAAVGPGVEGLKVGQRVAAFPDSGGYAEMVVARPVLTYVLPDGVSDEEGASVTMLVTAYNLLTMAGKLQRGERVLIHSAAGGVGSIAVQMARELGAGTIIATAGGPEKAKLAREYGAGVVIDYRSEPIPEKVLAATGGRGVDVVLDAVAGDTTAQSLPALAEGGRYCIYGMASGQPGMFLSNVLHTGNRSALGYTTGGYRNSHPEVLRPGVEAAFKLVSEGKVKVVVGARYPLRDAAEAHRHVESRASTGKVVLTP
jgi:NADPH2:quinone reductase